MLEQVIYEHLQCCEVLRPYLASYAGHMAIFNQEAPSDTDGKWAECSQYGRIVFALDTREDPERKMNGVLAVDVICEKGKQFPEEIEPILKPLIDGYFFTSEEVTVSAHWESSDLFTEDGANKINGVTLVFRLLAYPKQATTDPDPIEAVNKWSGGELQQVLGHGLYVVGDEALPSVFRPAEDKPAIYWRISRITKCGWIPDTNAASWQTATLQGHVMAPNHNDTEIRIARVITNTLTNIKRLRTTESVFMVDRANSINVSSGAKAGQVSVEVTYGIPNVPPESEKLAHITTRMKGG